MSKRKPFDKVQARERRNRMLDTAATAKLSLTEGVREMRAITGMTQEEFAQHRGVSARVIKAIELGQGNPTMATLNQIGQFFGLEVGFVPIRRTPAAEGQQQPVTAASERSTPQSAPDYITFADFQKTMQAAQAQLDANTRMLSEALARLNTPSIGTGQEPSSPKKRKPRAA
jgi:DNA-binding XRE family transcriptional regulator